MPASADPSPRSSRPLRRAFAVGAAVAIGITTLGAAEQAGAASSDEVRLVIDSITGTRVGRGAGAANITARVTNVSGVMATGVAARLALPAGIEFSAPSSTSGCTVAGTTVTCGLGALAAGKSRNLVIGVRETDPAGALGQRLGWFLPVTTNQFDPAAGEIWAREWDHEADGQGGDLSVCWPVTSPSPLMDTAGGGTAPDAACDGTIDGPALAPDADGPIDAFPDPFAATVTRSWEWVTAVTPPTSGAFRACGLGIDDGGYVAIAPIESPLTNASIVLNQPTFGSATSAPFAMTGGQTYKVLMRISNRGAAGIDNGGANLGGWDAFGIVPDGQACTSNSAVVFGIGQSAWTQRLPVPVEVAPTSDIGLNGMIIAPELDGARRSTARITNNGPDSALTTVVFTAPSDIDVPSEADGCILDRSSSAAACSLGQIEPSGAASVTLGFSGSALPRWQTQTAGVDPNPANDLLSR